MMKNQNNDIALNETAGCKKDSQPSLVAYLFLDTRGNVTDYDEQAAGLLNLSEANFESINLLEQAGDEQLAKAIEIALQGETTYYPGPVYLAGNLSNTNFATYLKPIFLSRKKLLGVACFIHYSKEGILSPYEFVQQAEYINLIARNTRDIISLHSIDGRMLFLSPSFEQVTGIPNDLVMQDSNKWPVVSEDRVLLNEVLDRMRIDPTPKSFEYRFQKSDGTIRWAESRFQIIKTSNHAGCIAGITRDITDRMEMEKALQLSEMKYRSLILNLPTGIILIDLKGRIAEANESFFKIIDLSTQDLQELTSLEEIDRKYQCDVYPKFIECIRGNKMIEGQQEFICKHGISKHIQYTFVPMPDDTGEVVHVMANVRDLTDLIMSEAKSRQQYDFLNMIINSLQEPFFVKDEKHRWIMLNDACINMMGYSKEDVLGKSDYDIYPKDQADVFWHMDDLVFQEGSNINEEEITWSSGEVRTIITSKYLYNDKLNGQKYIVGSIHDITRLKEIQETLKKSEQKFHDLFQNANDLIFTTDLKGNFTDANRRVVESLGIPLRKLLKSSIFDIVKSFEKKKLKEILLQLRDHHSVSALEVETVTADGSAITLEVHGRLMFNNDVPIGIQGIARDISEKKRYNQQLKQYNEELKELNKSKDKMFSIIAHDLKDPFNSLLGFSEILLDDFETLSGEEIRDYVKIINNTAKHSLNLLENLLTWSRLLTGRLPFTPMKLLLASEVDSATTIVSSLAYRKRITVDNLVPIDIAVFADQNMLLSILHNFVMNAIKFTNPGGKIEIDAGIADDQLPETEKKVIISIRDNGIGMTESEIEKLFQIKALYSTSGTQNEKGTGLGLLLTREMIERHGGTITVESKPTKGSTFTFTLPAAL